MEKRWSLDSLYPGLDSKEFKQDKKQFEKRIKKLEEWSFDNLEDEINTAEKFIKTLKEYYQLSMKLNAFSHLTVSVDANNEEALKMIEKLEKEMVRTTKPMVNFQLWLNEIDKRDKLYQKSELLAEHKFFIEELVDKSKYLLSENEEEIIAKLK